MELTEPGLRVKNAEKMQQSKRASGEEMRPAVSVIMPVYNGEKYIAQAVQSVYAQNIPLELIVIDDGSVDGTREALIPWENRPDFVYIKNERNLGAAGSRTRGVLRKADMWHFWMQMTGGKRENWRHSWPLLK